MKLAITLIAIVILALLLPFFLPDAGRFTSDPERDLPWQITFDGQGRSTVFGLTPGVSTFADVRRKFGDDMELAIIATPQELGALEAYYGQAAFGFVLGRLVVTLDAPDALLVEMRERALKAQRMESATRKITLHPDDIALADRLPVRALAVIPSVNLDEAVIVERFGRPEERIAVDGRVHLLYPARGLDILLDGKGKELLQYVAPRDFGRLRDPLMENAGSDKAS